MKVYILSYCQNEYQRERVIEFIKSKRVEIVNPDFGKRKRNEFYYLRSRFPYNFIIREYLFWEHIFFPYNLVIEENCESLIETANEVWIILEMFIYPIFRLEMIIREIKPCRYFKINHVGRYAGRTREVERNFFKPKYGRFISSYF